jgi:hypothetical protein
LNIATKFTINENASDDTGPIADTTVAFSISKSVNVSRLAHVWTDFTPTSGAIVYRIEVSEPRCTICSLGRRRPARAKGRLRFHCWV